MTQAERSARLAAIMQAALARRLAATDASVQTLAGVFRRAESTLLLDLARQAPKSGVWKAADMAQLENTVTAWYQGVAQELRGMVPGAVAVNWSQGAALQPRIGRELHQRWGFNRPSVEQAGVATDHLDNLVVRLSDRIRADIQTQIRLGVLGSKSSSEVMKAISGYLATPDRQSIGPLWRQAETVWRTESMRIFNMANLQRIKELGQTMPGVRKRWSHDGRPKQPRPYHEALHGTTIPWDAKFTVIDPKGQGWLCDGPHDVDLPVGEVVNCLPGDTFVDASQALLVLRTRYRGDVIEVRSTASVGGKEERLTVTPNHPVLTTRGWVAAGKLCPGDSLLCDGAVVRGDGRMLRQVDDKHAPTQIGELFHSLQANGAVSTPVSAGLDLYGDQFVDKSYIDVVGVNGLVLDDFRTQLTKAGRQFIDMEFATMVPLALTSDGPCPELGGGVSGAPDGGVGGSGMATGETRVFGHAPRRGEPGGLSLPSDGDTRIPEQPGGQHPANSKPLSDVGQAEATQIKTGNLALTVVGVRRKRFDGHVYDLSTVDGFFAASDRAGAIVAGAAPIVKNCGCSAHAVAWADEDEPDYDAALARQGDYQLDWVQQNRPDLLATPDGLDWLRQYRPQALKAARRSGGLFAAEQLPLDLGL